MRSFVVCAVLLISFDVLADARDLANRILSRKEATQNGLWYICGEKASDHQAYEWATAVIESSRRHDLNYQGLAAVIDQESGWDYCAIGKKAREWGIRKGLITRRKITISVTLPEVLATVSQYPGPVDLGPGQLMYRSVFRGEIGDLLSIRPGVEIVAREMAKRANGVRSFNTNLASKPWYMWPGGVSESYGRKIDKLINKLFGEI